VYVLRLLRTFAFIWLAIPAHGQDRSALGPILTFEGPHSGACPAGWYCSVPDTIAVDGDVVHGGKWSVRIARQPDSKQAFSTITKSIPIDFAGTALELRGFIRTQDVREYSAFWMREDGLAGSVAFASMQGHEPAKGTTPWTEYSISLPLNPKATKLFFGFLLGGPGKAWADDLQLLIDGKPVANALKMEALKTVLDTDHEFDGGSRIMLSDLTAVQIDNLATLGKVWGFLKYHHPRVTAGHRHFDYDLLRVLPAILAAPDRSAANAALVRWIEGLGDAGACMDCAKLDEHDLYMRPDLDWISNESRLGPDLSRILRRIRDNRPADGKQFYVSLMRGVGNPSFENEPDYSSTHLPDAGFQILALFRFWNIIAYWYPYRELTGGNWDAVLAGALPKIALARDADTYKREMIGLIAKVHDTHANLWGSLGARPPAGACQLPVNIRFVENQAVVASYADPDLGQATGLRRGDVLEQLDGVAADQLIRDWTPFYAASNDPTRLRDIGISMTKGDCTKPAVLQVRRGHETLDLRPTRVPPNALDFKTAGHDQPGETFRRLSRDIAYLKLSSVKIADAASYIDSAAGAKGLIVDIRNYPSEFVVFALGELLIEKPTEFVRFTVGDLANPGAFHWGSPLSLTPRKPHYAGKIVILIDEVSQSQAEYTTMAFRSAPEAFVIGSTTAGADGNVSNIPLPGGIHSMISGIGVFYPDKKPTQRIGILPDEVVTPTIAGIRDGRDEVLEAAIRHISGADTSPAEVESLARPPEIPTAPPITEFHDEQSGIALKLPDGWKSRDPLRWGDQQATLFLSGGPSGSVAALYFQVLRDPRKMTVDETEKALHEDAEIKQKQRRSEAAGDYQMRAGSCVDRTVSGHPALSCVADYTEDGHAVAEYLTWVRTDRLIVLFFGHSHAAGLEAFRQSFDRVIAAISIP
jgi:C-terminal processing protease CtpA/Prc